MKSLRYTVWLFALLQSSAACLLLLLPLCCGGATPASSLAGGDGISGTGDFQLSKLSFAHESYGSVKGSDMMVTSLAPIIVARFAEPLPPEPKSFFRVTLVDLLEEQSLVSNPGSAFFDALQVVRGADHRDLYLHLPKTDGLGFERYELKPGGRYHFKVEHLAGGEFFVGDHLSPVFEGHLTVSDMTITYLGDFSTGDALVNDGDALTGLASLRPEFIIHSNRDFPVQDRGPLSALSFEIFGSVFSGSALERYLEVKEVSGRGAKISFYSQVFSPGMELTITVSAHETLAARVSNEVLPSTVKLQFQEGI